MLLYTQNQCNLIRKAAWLEAVRFFGSERKLGIFLGVEQSTISKWINNSKIAIPHDKALAVEEAIGHISIERLLPNHPINNYLYKRCSINNLTEILTNKIVLTDLPYLTFQRSDRNIIVGSNNMLISGLVELQAYKEANTNKIKVISLDLVRLLLKTTSKYIQDQFTIMELVAIGCALKQLLGNRQGQRSDLKHSKSQINSNNFRSLDTILDQVTGRNNHIIAKIFEFSIGTYLNAEQVYLNGSKELIIALENKEISIARAATVAKFPKNQQSNFIKLKTGETLCPGSEQ